MLPKFHSARLRAGRFSERGRAYLVTMTCRERTPLFKDFLLARAIVAELVGCEQGGFCRTMAWVLMPDHMHWLLVLETGDLSSLMRRFKSRSAIAVNHLRQMPGVAVWQRGFHDHALRQEDDIQDVARYIVANPLRAGLVKRVGDYPFWGAVWL